MKLRYFVADAFTDAVFGGNPAGVCALEGPLDAALMQRIAAENNLSETAFVYPAETPGDYNLRWFTPNSEIDLCGHATLGTSFIVANFVTPGIETMRFSTMSGILTVQREGELFTMDFPNRMPTPVDVTPEMTAVMGAAPQQALLSRDLVLVYENRQQVADLKPDLNAMQQLPDGLGVIATAPGDGEADFVCRCFYPKLNVPEDPVTGSAHSNLIPLWAEKLGKTEMISHQISARGGVLRCRLAGERVRISGKAALYLQGEINV